MRKAETIWMNGEFVAWDDARVHVLSHGLHYGTGVFEGIRAYETGSGTAVFRHLRPPDPARAVGPALLPADAIRARGAPGGDERADPPQRARLLLHPPDPFRGYGEMGLFAESPVEVTIAAWPWGAYLGEESKQVGVRAKVSSWRRISPDGLIPHAKASGQYLNSILAKTEAHNAGYDEAILLDQRGLVCEGSGENIFVIRDGEILTPPHTASILDGINRKSVMQIARDLDFNVVERDIGRSELYLADEIFLTGTAAELVPVREIDDHPIEAPGEITKVIAAKFDDALHGRAPEYAEWLDPVDEPSKVAS